MEPRFKQATVIGVGLIGGSIAGVMKKKGLAGFVVGVGRGPENLDTAKKAGLIDRFTSDAKKGVAGSDLVILCCPVGMFEAVAREIKPYLADQAIVTDAGSVKGALVGRLEEIFYLKARYVPAHPIAGSERSGAAAADLKLFEGARCIITPTRNTDLQAIEAVTSLWEAAGMTVQRMDPFEHDRVFALVSHLPHVAAYAMVGALAGMDGGEKAIAYAAGGFKDFTRIAASHPGMWRDICILNGQNIVNALDRYQDALRRLRDLIEKGDGETLAAEFEKARDIRQKIK
ncbi:MAG TPA: prephenate dehydrogenase/arogenate dehydrogenase family protein [Nitrospirota bacterium]|nr:prephenate dehydrogenase/arogenate dehydrogenase family protein [Nitrospirota bacterium]